MAMAFQGVALEAKGGRGGDGRAGETGMNGADGPIIVVSDADLNEYDWEKDAELTYAPRVRGGAGFDGSKGRTGQQGGIGGNISVSFVSYDAQGSLWTWHDQYWGVPGGDGGSGGPGGPGGQGGARGVATVHTLIDFWGDIQEHSTQVVGAPGQPGAPGPVGDVGPSGAVGSKAVQQVDEPQFWTLAAQLAPRWFEHRLDMARYHYRRWSSVDNEASRAYGLALNEALAAIHLRPDSMEALAIERQLSQNLNVLGLPRDLDVVPDFVTWEETFLKYRTLIADLWQVASSTLLTAIPLEHVADGVARDIASLDQLKGSLAAQKAAAELGLQIANLDALQAKQSVDRVTAEIQAKKAALDKVQVDYLGIAVGALSAVAGVIAAIPTGGASLIAVVPAFAKVIDAVSDGARVAALIAEASKPANERTELNKLAAEAKGVLGYIREIANAARVVISFPKMLAELADFHTSDPAYQEMIGRSVALVHEQMLADLRVKQAQLGLDAQKQRELDAVKSRIAAADASSKISSDSEFLEEFGLRLLTSLDYGLDFITRYAFLSARAVELSTFSDLSDAIRFDYGHIHPDIMRGHKDGLRPLAEVVAAYQHEWVRVGTVLSYRERYDRYRASGTFVNDLHRVSLTTPSSLSVLEQTGVLEFTISVADLPPTRREARVQTAWVALVGASAAPAGMPVILEHTGIDMVRLRTEETITRYLTPKRAAVQAKVESLPEPSGILGYVGPDAAFWGKGLAARWVLRIEPHVRSGLNLSELAEVQVWFQYESFYHPDGVSLEPSEKTAEAPGSRENQLRAPDNGTVLVDSSGEVYLVEHCAKYKLTSGAVFARIARNERRQDAVILGSLPYGGVREISTKGWIDHYHLVERGADGHRVLRRARFCMRHSQLALGVAKIFGSSRNSQ